jgi:hypothetical protein
MAMMAESVAGFAAQYAASYCLMRKRRAHYPTWGCAHDNVRLDLL